MRTRTALLAIGLVLGCASSRQLRGPPAVEPVSPGAIEYTLLVVGDAGHATGDDPVLAAMAAAAASAGVRAIFLPKQSSTFCVEGADELTVQIVMIY